MKILSFLSSAIILSSLSIGITYAATNAQEARTVVFYADPANQEETRQVLEECKSRVKTVFDYEIVMGQENCKNAQIGEVAAFRKKQRDDIEAKKDTTAPLHDSHSSSSHVDHKQ